jgi:deoxyribose-phosphate aldolase
MKLKLLKCPEDNAIIRKLINNMDNAQLLVPDVSAPMVDRVCEESVYYGFNSVVATPHTVERTAGLLRGTPVHTLFGFGDAGRGGIEGKVETLKKVLKYGVEEVDMIMNMPRFLEGRFDIVQKDVETLREICKAHGASLKLIIESGLLTDEQRRQAVEIGIAGGVDFIKTASGSVGTGTCNMRLILLLKEAIAGRAKLKASSGLQTLEDAWAFMEAGADRTAGRDNMTNQLKELGYKPA